MEGTLNPESPEESDYRFQQLQPQRPRPRPRPRRRNSSGGVGARCNKKKLVIMVCIISSIILLAIVLTSLIPTNYLVFAQYQNAEQVVANGSVRLPTNVRPMYYKLDLIPHVSPAENFTIDGVVRIEMICQEPDSSSITLHIKRIQVNETSVVVVTKPGNTSTRNLNILKHEYEPTRDFYTVTLDETLQVGSLYSIYIEYTAELSDELVGFYRSSYVDKTTNNTRWLGVTQFSPTDARRAFPSFDEPAMKAKFEISLGRRQNMTSISNMNLLTTEPISGMAGWYWDHYNVTLPMSTYLVGFAVTDFVPELAKDSKIKFQVWARKDAIDQTEYARDIGPKVLHHFEEYFGIDFPLPKQDMIAVPDHRFSAMENWGLITYRELFVLYDQKFSSDSNKRRIAEVVSHELAHQWFGNLVTPSWWSDLWLKEGFASYIEYIGTDHVEPDWKVLDLFVTNELQTVFRKDALNVSHQISIPVNDPSEINRIFDDISYKKGCTIIRMMDHFLTHATFKQGITNYLNKWKYNNTKQDDVWESLTEQGHIDGTLAQSLTVGEIMDTWTLQKGFPVIQIERNYSTNIVKFEQSKFQLLRTNSSEEFENYRWWVPISLASPKQNANFSDSSPRFWISKDTKTSVQQLEGIGGEDDWLIANVQQTGYYRVNYDMKNWQNILNQLQKNKTAIHVVNRAQLVDDSLTLSRGSLLPYEFTLNFTKYLEEETEYLPWYSFGENLRHLYDILLKTPAIEHLKSYVRKLIQNEYNRVGFLEKQTDNVLLRTHRANILNWACKTDLRDCVEKSIQIFKEWMSKFNPIEENPIPVNLRGVIYCRAIENGGDKEWNFAWERYLEVNVASEKDRILTALSCTTSAETLKKYLTWAITPGSGVRKQDSRSVLQNVAYNKIGNALVFRLLQDEWPAIRKYYGPGISIDRIINNGISTKLNTPEDLKELEKFKADHKGEFGAGTAAVEEAIEIVQTNIYWMNNNYETVASWLQNALGN